MGIKNILEREGRITDYRGYVIPYILIFMGFVYLVITPLNVERLQKKSGKLIKLHKSSYSKFKIEGVKDAFVVQNKKNKRILKKELPNAKQIEVWTKKISSKKGLVMQLEVDGRMVIKYSWWYHAKVPVFFIVIGLILLPLVRKEWKEMKCKEEV